MSAPLTAATMPQTGAAEHSRMELQAKLNGIGGLNGRKLDPEVKAKKLREACEGFESIFIQKMWQEMRNTVPKSNLLSGREEKFWQDMYDQELSKSMTRAGGIGLADMMFEQLSRGLASASSSTAGNVSGAAFTPGAAPLVIPAKVEEQAPVEAAENTSVKPMQPMAAIYEGEAPEVSREPAELSRPDVSPTGRKQELRHSATHTHQPGSRVSRGNNGSSLSYRAMREAGDKLSAGAVRPSLYGQRNNSKKSAEAAVEAAPAAPAHGSAESLAAALELARTGGAVQPGQGNANLNSIVAEAKLRNSLAGASQEAAPIQEVSAEPVVRKTTFTTNIPAHARAGSKKSGDAIRVLNVDKVSVNSKQGKGLAAYHAAQAAAAENAQEQPAAPIAPLTARESAQETHSTSFAIPPLKAGDLRS